MSGKDFKHVIKFADDNALHDFFLEDFDGLKILMLSTLIDICRDLAIIYKAFTNFLLILDKDYKIKEEVVV